MKVSIVNFLSLLFLLIPVSLLTGSFLPDLLLVIISITFISYALYNRELKYFKNIFFVIFMLFNLFLISSSLLSEYQLLSLKSSLVYFRFGFFSLAVWFILDKNDKITKYFLYSLVISFLIALIYGYYNYFSYSMDENNTRLPLLFSDRYLLGNYLVRLFPLLLALIFIRKKINKKLLLILGIFYIAIDCLIFISGERSAFFLLFLLTIFLLLTLNKFRYLRLITIIFSLIIIIAISINNPEIKERNFDTTFNQLGLNNDSIFESQNDKIFIFSRYHENYFINAIEIYKNNILFGSGPNTFRKHCSDKLFESNNVFKSNLTLNDVCSTHPHNSYLQLLSETGIIGFSFIFITFIYFSIIIFKYVFRLTLSRDAQLNNYQICLLGCFLINLWPFIPTLNFFNNWINIFYYLPVGFYLNSIYQLKNEKKNVEN